MWRPELENGYCCNGCLPLSRMARVKQSATVAAAISLPEYSWVDQADMPVIRWDSAFEEWLQRRIDLADSYTRKGLSLYPWDIAKNVPKDRKRSDIIHWNQGYRPSCCLHGATHAYQFTELISMALGAPYTYEALNPIVPFYLAKGGSLAGGLDLLACAEFINVKGQYPSSLVGDDNIDVPRNYREYTDQAKNWQAGIVYIENDFENKIFKACHALCAINFGSGQFYTSGRVDSNGVKVVTSVTTGGHAECFCGYRVVNGTEYVFVHNSHGDAYGQSDEGEPKWGGWVSRDLMRLYTRDMGNYGYPFLVFAEGVFNTDSLTLSNPIKIPKLPSNWRM